MTARPIRSARAAAVLPDRVDGDDHQPDRPEWDCLACQQPWPCPPGRVRLGEAYTGDRVGLAVYMAGQLDQAVTELAGATPRDLFDRFVSWTR